MFKHCSYYEKRDRNTQDDGLRRDKNIIEIGKKKNKKIFWRNLEWKIIILSLVQSFCHWQ